jgi:ribosomal protein S18 acetylase RimI-like enzyme
LFAQARPELALLPPAVGTLLIDQQVRAQRAQYDVSYPTARHDILTVDGVDVGRLILATGRSDVRVVDVTVRAERRGEGIATSVLTAVTHEADRLGLPVVLSVWPANDGARRLYERLGFAVTSDPGDGSHLSMRRPPTAEGR